MDWSTQFKNYIDNFTDINTFNLDVLKNNNIKYTDDIQVLYNIKLQTDLINGKNIFFGNNNYNNTVNKYIFFKNEYITNIFNLYFKDKYKYSNKINKIDFKKYKYFVKCKFDDNTEYIKFNPNFEKENMESILKKCKFKILCVPWIMKSNKYYGVSGATGYNNMMGSTGATGYNNMMGNTGATGYNNTMGSTGATGYNNTMGNTGTTGYNSTMGNTGATGYNNMMGSTGATGYNNTMGSTGATGYNSTMGNTGTTGYNNTMGNTGATGYNNMMGNTGATGYNNTMGNTGASGYNNTSSSNSNIIIGLKIDSIVIEYNKNLLDYKSIKDIINIVSRNKKLDISDIIDDTEIAIKVESKFNKYKFKNKRKIDNSNNKILDFINHNSQTF